MFVRQVEDEVSLSKRLKKRIYQYLKESTLAEELKKNNVDVREFEEVSFGYTRN